MLVPLSDGLYALLYKAFRFRFCEHYSLLEFPDVFLVKQGFQALLGVSHHTELRSTIMISKAYLDCVAAVR